MITFSLDRANVSLEHMNVRSEFHGEDQKSAADLKFSWSCPNDILSQFHASLKATMFRAPDPGEQQELVDDPNYLPHLRFPKMAPIAWEDEIVGAEVVVHWGASGKGDIVLEGCTVDKFKFALVDGGSVFVTLRVKCHPTESQVGKLFGLIGHETEISIEPPAEGAELPKAA